MTKNIPATDIFVCNDADLKNKKIKKYKNLKLGTNLTSGHNITVSLPNFISSVYHLEDKYLDLLEIASFIFSADRMSDRGDIKSVEYHSWARRFDIYIKVRDFNFWNQEKIKSKLNDVLCFMTGDYNYNFIFQPGHSTHPVNLFDNDRFSIETETNSKIMLFSGGLDSYSGLIELLNTTQDKIYLVSHQSNNKTKRTQQQLFQYLDLKYPNRLKFYKYQCHLSGQRADEETQRTRSFLYTSIAFTLAHALKLNNFYVFENGITGMNFPKRQDLINARASRTTHPKTIKLLEDFFCEFENNITIKTPYFYKTKTEIFYVLMKYNCIDDISSTVSCSKTFRNNDQTTHCGGCSQCIDRRFASFASGLHEKDISGNYSINFINESIPDGEIKTTIIDYIRQARDFANWSNDYFNNEMIKDLTNIIPFIAGTNYLDKCKNIWELCNRHGKQVMTALKFIQNLYDDPFLPIRPNSLLDIINKRDYLIAPVYRLATSISENLTTNIPLIFQTEPPKNEKVLNDAIQGLISKEADNYEREHPTVRFSITDVKADHSISDCQLLIESKYLKEKSSPSVSTEGIAADLTKYSKEKFILFIIYDPFRSIHDDEKFKKDFEKTREGMCLIKIIR